MIQHLIKDVNEYWVENCLHDDNRKCHGCVMSYRDDWNGEMTCYFDTITEKLKVIRDAC